MGLVVLQRLWRYLGNYSGNREAEVSKVSEQRVTTTGEHSTDGQHRISNMTLRDCRAPFCRYRAPLCEYSYCAECCRKYHNFAVSGIQKHQMPPGAKENGYQVINRKADILALPTKPIEVRSPVPGEITATTITEYPLESV